MNYLAPESCALCAHAQSCEASAPFALFATTPILRTLLAAALSNSGLPFRSSGDVFILDRSVDEAALRSLAAARLSPRETDDIRIARARGASLIDSQSLTHWLRQTDTAWFDKALETDSFTTHFQPIVDVREGRIHGHECLVRLFLDRPYNGGEIMEAAVGRGRTHIFDSYMRQLSVRSAAAQNHPGAKVFINFLPSSIYDPAFCMKSTLQAMAETALTPADIVFEVVESERILDPRHLQRICNYYRDGGFGFALDDVGTGSNSLQMVCDLRPDYIKIDKSLISGLGQSMYRSTVRKISELAAEFSVNVIAEGIEDARTAAVCLDAGIRYMQGYYFGRPSADMRTCNRDMLNLKTEIERHAAYSPVTPAGQPVAG